MFDFSVMLQDHSSKVMKLFEDIFGWLPLATVVNNKILVAHGGISNITDLSFIDKIDRHRVRILPFSGPSNLNPNQTLLDYFSPGHPMIPDRIQEIFFITRDDVVSQRLKFGSVFLSSSWESKIALFF